MKPVKGRKAIRILGNMNIKASTQAVYNYQIVDWGGGVPFRGPCWVSSCGANALKRLAIEPLLPTEIRNDILNSIDQVGVRTALREAQRAICIQHREWFRGCDVRSYSLFQGATFGDSGDDAAENRESVGINACSLHGDMLHLLGTLIHDNAVDPNRQKSLTSLAGLADALRAVRGNPLAAMRTVAGFIRAASAEGKLR